MNIIDISVICLLVFFGILGVLRGLIRQLFSFGGLIAGHLAGIKCCKFAVSTLNLQFKYAELAGYLVILAVVYIVFVVSGWFIVKKIRNNRLSVVDRVFGLLAGLVKGGVLAVLLVFVLVILLPKDALVLRKSIAAPQAIVAGKWLAKGFPAQISDSFTKKIWAIDSRPPRFLFFR